jgi:hypothetical protein
MMIPDLFDALIKRPSERISTSPNKPGYTRLPVLLLSDNGGMSATTRHTALPD